jgi:hypothetical protein
MIESRRIRWTGHITRIGGEEERVYVIGGKIEKIRTAGKTKM